ncbi:MAG: TRAP transporter small permease [Deltaproteobacteria bacterium]|nr:TRAP transporter small permease [Deltaproteobacteria bacterium]MBW2072934.1 TRAP transporter small permease [Deltaproteobacteria bacterium]
MTSRLLQAARSSARIFRQLETMVLVALVVLLAGFSLLQIILRNILSTGLVWGDDLLRHGVLWISFLGAARATAERKHITIDILPRILPARGQWLIEVVNSLFCSVVCVILLAASWVFVLDERLAGGIAFAGIPYWWLEMVFPFSFALMAFRFACNGIATLLHLSVENRE